VNAALGVLGAIGRPVVSAARWLLEVGGMVAAVAVHATRGATWRPTVRQAFVLAARDAILGALPATLLLSLLVGLGLLYQALYWLEAAGQASMIGRVIVWVLVRELAPALVALVLGRKLIKGWRFCANTDSSSRKGDGSWRATI